MSNVALAHLKDTLVGPTSVIRDLVEIRPSGGAPRIFNCSCVLSNTERILGARVPGSTGAAGLTKEDAEICAIGEAVERYSAAFIPWDRLQHGAAADLNGLAIGVDEFCIYEDAVYSMPQFPIVRYTPDRPIFWKDAISAASGEKRYVPASLVYVPYQYRDLSKRSDFVGMAVSTGQACHQDRDAALLSGLYECIERDAFMITWTRGLEVPMLCIDSNARLKQLYLDRYAGCEVDFRLFDITLDIPVPTVLCVAVANGPKGKFATVGCATRLSLQDSCEKAMLEAAQCLSWAHHLMEARADWQPAPDFSNLRIFEDHVRLYCEPYMLKEFDFLLTTPLRGSVPDKVSAVKRYSSNCETVVRAVTTHGYEPLIVDLTTDELAELGLNVLKVMVPGLATLNAVHVWPAMACPRYRDIPAKLGRRAKFDIANPAPHPFP